MSIEPLVQNDFPGWSVGRRRSMGREVKRLETRLKLYEPPAQFDVSAENVPREFHNIRGAILRLVTEVNTYENGRAGLSHEDARRLDEMATMVVALGTRMEPLSDRYAETHQRSRVYGTRS